MHKESADHTEVLDKGQSAPSSVNDKPQAICQWDGREKIRQNYLRSMGIQTWYPRYQLIQARPAREFAQPEEVEKAQMNVTSSDNSIGHEKSSSQIASKADNPTSYGDLSTTFSDIIDQKRPSFELSETAIPTDHSSAPAVEKQKSAEIKFRLVVQSVNDDCLVIAEMPHSGINQFTRFHQRLLNDILKALRIHYEAEPKLHEFLWPMTANVGILSKLNKDEYAATDAVQAYLSNQYGLSRRKVILLFGRSAARFVIDPEKDFEQLVGIQEGIHADQRFIVTHGLTEMMKQSQLKKEAWLDLSGVSRRLQD